MFLSMSISPPPSERRCTTFPGRELSSILLFASSSDITCGQPFFWEAIGWTQRVETERAMVGSASKPPPLNVRSPVATPENVL